MPPYSSSAVPAIRPKSYKRIKLVCRIQETAPVSSPAQGRAMGKNTIGENIRRLRRQQDLKQDVLAVKLNIRRQTLSAYERGVTVPDIYVLIRVADYFGISLDELTGRRTLVIPDERD